MEFFQLTRRTAQIGTFKTTYANRLVDASGHVVLEGETTRGYITAPVQFTAPDASLLVTFGGNRRIAPSALELRDGNATILASLPTGMAQTTLGKVDQPVLDASGAEMMRIRSVGLPGTEAAQAGDRPTLNDLAVVATGRMLAHTVRRNADIGASPSMATLVDKALATLDAARKLASAFQTINASEDRVIATLTLTAEGRNFDPRLALAVLLYKIHYVEQALS